ncbi:MFS transporter [Algoriphagus sp. NG3]|uniref:MFS transporter n=1 Tax=Algoriphagus sp. NG3 TaxID=3097546 RepID=UPI002A80211E|nr:MFS transporter [Algoriphagus sp. NG3]WPR75319.1 MFS transporter [Algoriphagus sp. NG3]
MESTITIPSDSEVGRDKISAYLWSVFLICFLGNATAGTISTIASVYLPVIADQLANAGSAEQIYEISAYINALYLVGWAIGGMSWGLISDKIGRAKSLAMCLAAVGIFTICVSFASSWEVVVGLRLLGGIAVGGVMVITMTLLSEVWPAKTRSVVMGIVSIGFPVGIFSSGLVNLWVNDWRQAFFIGALPLILAAISSVHLKESPKWKLSQLNIVGAESRKNSHFKAPGLIHGAVVFGTMLIALWSAFSWMPTWVQSLLQESSGQTERGSVMMILGFGGILGGILSGWIVKVIGVRKSMLICFSGALGISILLYGFTQEFSMWIYPAITCLSFFFGISQGLLSFYIPQLFAIEIRAGATGFCFNAGRVITALAVFSLGSLVVYLGGYGNALLLFSGFLLIGFFFVLISKSPSQLNNQ